MHLGRGGGRGDQIGVGGGVGGGNRRDHAWEPLAGASLGWTCGLGVLKEGSPDMRTVHIASESWASLPVAPQPLIRPQTPSAAVLQINDHSTRIDVAPTVCMATSMGSLDAQSCGSAWFWF